MKTQINQREMTRITIEVDFEIDDVWSANSYDQEEKDWFWNEVIPTSMIVLHNNDVGDTVATSKSFTIKQITFNTNQENLPDSTNGYTYYPQENKTVFNTKEK